MPTRRVLEQPSSRREAEFVEAVARSRRLHGRWVSPPSAPAELSAYLRRLNGSTHLGFFVVTEDDELAGVVNVSEIVRGAFCSAYLGYYAFVPHERSGRMTLGMRAVISEAFGRRRLHRLEANVQPGNIASRAFVERLGFRLEGVSPRYLKVGGRWRDHERWAITAEEWKVARSRR